MEPAKLCWKAAGQSIAIIGFRDSSDPPNDSLTLDLFQFSKKGSIPISIYKEENSMFLTSTLAHAQDAVATAPGPQGGFIGMVLPFVFMIGIMYFLMIRPQQKRQSQIRDFVNSLKRGDSVLTSSGILGTIEGITEKWVTLSIANDVNIRILKSAVVGPAQTDEAKK
jgi:preprotein translocase subunit YajC